MTSNNRFEIIATVDGTPRVVDFKEVRPLGDRLTAVMLLWDTNSYFVTCEGNAFVINGGREFPCPHLGRARIECRRRTSVHVAVSGGETQQVSWLLGLRSESGDVLFLCISECGQSWSWQTAL